MVVNDANVALVRQAIFHVLDTCAGRDFEDDQHRVDFADAVVAWMATQEQPTIGADVREEFNRIRRNYRGIGDGAWACAMWYAEALSRSRAEIELHAKQQFAKDQEARLTLHERAIKAEDRVEELEELVRWLCTTVKMATDQGLERANRSHATTAPANPSEHVSAIRPYVAALQDRRYNEEQQAMVENATEAKVARSDREGR